MPDRLTLGATAVLVAAVLGLAFGAAVLLGGAASAAKPIAERGPALVRNPPGPAMELGLTAALAVPALRASRKGRTQLRTPTRIVTRSVTPAVTLISAPVAPAESARPTPTAVPRPVASPPPRVVAAPTPNPEPTPFATPVGSGDFDTTGEPASAVTDEAPDPNTASGSVTR
jgi:hypothetical protein